MLVKFTVTEATYLVPFQTTFGPGMMPSNAATMDDKNCMYFCICLIHHVIVAISKGRSELPHSHSGTVHPNIFYNIP